MSELIRNFVIDLPVTIIETYFMFYLMRRKTIRDHRIKKVYMMYLINCIAVIVLSEAGAPAPVKILMSMIIIVYGGFYTYQVTKLSMVLYGMIYMLVLLCGDAIGSGMWFFASQLNNEYAILNEDILSVEILILIKAINFAFIVLIEKLLYKNGNFRLRDIYPYLISGLATVLILICISYNFLQIENRMLAVVLLIASLIGLLSFLFNTAAINRYIEMKETEYQRNQSLYELQLKSQYYQEKLIEEEKIREIYHDFKNHLLLLESGAVHLEKARETTQKLFGKIAVYENYYNTGNELADIIINEKMKKMKDIGIEADIEADMHAGGFLELLDISTILGNLFDNAIEASINIQEKEIKRFIAMRIKEQNGFIIIRMKNNVGKADKTNQYATAKSDKKMHGFGISNIKKSVRKYGGECDYGYEGAEFIFRIIIPLPAKSLNVSNIENIK